MERPVKEDRKVELDPGPASGQRKPYEPPAIIFTTKVEARAVVCSKADGNCTLGPASS
jgi:hypothetical protein